MDTDVEDAVSHEDIVDNKTDMWSASVGHDRLVYDVLCVVVCYFVSYGWFMCRRMKGCMSNLMVCSCVD